MCVFFNIFPIHRIEGWMCYIRPKIASYDWFFSSGLKVLHRQTHAGPANRLSGDALRLDAFRDSCWPLDGNFFATDRSVMLLIPRNGIARNPVPTGIFDGVARARNGRCFSLDGAYENIPYASVCFLGANPAFSESAFMD